MLSVWLLPLSSCRLVVQPKLVANEKLIGIPKFDPNDYNIVIHYETYKAEDGSEGYRLKVEDNCVAKAQQADTTRLKYTTFTKKAAIKCKIDSRTYPVLFDTGNPRLAHITTAHVQENQLPIYPLTFTTSNHKTVDFGVAMIEKLKIGDLMITNLPAEYRYYHTGYLPLGIPIIELGQDKEINIPLSVMQKFKYITFDSIKNQMEFSLKKSFSPANCERCQGACNSWKSYPLMTTEDGYIYIKSTLEGVPVRLLVDTGSEGDLILTKDSFDKMIEKQPKLLKAWKLNKTGHAPIAGGDFSYQSYFVNGLTFDQYKYNLHTIVEVVGEDIIYDLLEEIELDGIIGFPFFEDTVMALDFEHGKMWVKKARNSRFLQ